MGNKIIKNDELLDLVNEKDVVIGTVLKSEAHKDPTKILRQVDLVIFNDKGEVLLQQRSLNKRPNPGKWANSASGHVKAGESPDKAVIRETFEELGIKVKPVFFKKIFNEKRMESRFIWIYYVIAEGNPKLKIDNNELKGFRWIDPDILHVFAKENYNPKKSFMNFVPKCLKEFYLAYS